MLLRVGFDGETRTCCASRLDGYELMNDPGEVLVVV